MVLNGKSVRNLDLIINSMGEWMNKNKREREREREKERE